MVLFTMAGCSKTPSLPYALTDDFKRLGAGTSDMLMAFEEACPALSDGKQTWRQSVQTKGWTNCHLLTLGGTRVRPSPS